MRVLSCHLGLPHAPCSALTMEATKRTLPPISHADKRHADVHPPPDPLDTCGNRRPGGTTAPFVSPRPKGGPPALPQGPAASSIHTPARTLPGGI